jgi:hypothetical protein
MIRTVRLLLVATTLALLGGCGGVPRPSVPADLPPDQVLVTYLQALVAGDCDGARRVTAPTFGKGNGELCGEVRVRAFEPPDGSAGSDTERVFHIILTTDGDGGQSIDPGRLAWFYSVQRQPDGRWLVAGGGSGP